MREGVPDRPRCFGDDDPLMAAYHDREWGVPLFGDRALFELLTLEIFQAGLSWRVILHKRAAFRRAFDGFDPLKVRSYGAADLDRLLSDDGIVRNRSKIEATINNASVLGEMSANGDSFSELLWSFTGGKPVNGPRAERLEDLRAQSSESEAMAAELVTRGFRFVGPTICYAFMQAAGMIDDHIVGCFKYSRRS